MAEFCKECSLEHFNEDLGDLRGLCQPGMMVATICEGCGYIYVDHNGQCMGGPSCQENHKGPEVE